MSQARLSMRPLPLLLALVAANYPHHVRAECKMVETGRLPITVVDNALLIPGGINDHDISILMDTGASESFILKSAVDNAGAKAVRDSRYVLNSEEDDSTVYKVKVDALRVGNSVIRRNTWTVFNIQLEDSGIGMVLGADFWSQIDYEIDLRNGEVILWDNKDCEKAALGYWSKEYMVAFLDGKNGRYPVAKATVNGTPLRAIIDTGSPASYMDAVTARRLGYRLADGSEPTDSDREHGHVGKFDLFELGDLTIKNAAIIVPRIGFHLGGLGNRLRGTVPTETQMSLGVDFLNANHVLVANSQGYLYMTYNGGRVFQTHITSLEDAQKNLEEGNLRGNEFLSKAGTEALLRGTIAHNKGDYTGAEADLRSAYMELKNNGKLDSDAGRQALGMLSRSLYEQEKFSESIPLLQALIPIEERVSGPEHGNVAALMHVLSAAYLTQHKYADALATLNAAQPIFEKTQGANSVPYMEFLHLLGTALEGTADYKRAEDTYRQAMTIAEMQPEPDRPNMARALMSIGRAQESQKRYEEAANSYERAREIFAGLPDSTRFVESAKRAIQHVQDAKTR